MLIIAILKISLNRMEEFMYIILGIILFFVISFIGPFYLYITKQVELHGDYRTANRASANIAPRPEDVNEAIILIYAARTFNWRGLFAVHTWIATKTKNAKHYVVHQKIGWLLLRNLPPVLTEEDLPDRHWFNQKPVLILDIRGEKAEKLISKIHKEVKNYPFTNKYSYWPGPNSNTFIAFIGRKVPELRLLLPSIAMGKDYLMRGFFVRAISGTGFQISFYGMLGLTLALKEGIEINILGLVYGISLFPLAIKLPGFGDLRFFK